MSTMAHAMLSSPTFTATSTASSFDLVSTRSRSSSTNSNRSLQFYEDSDDEIVWSVASSGILSPSALSTESSIISTSDDDFVVLNTNRNGLQRRRDPRSQLSTPSPRGESDAGASNDSSSLSSALNGLSLSTPGTPTKRSKSAKSRKNKKASAPSSPAPAISPAIERPSSAATLTASTPSSPKRRNRTKKLKDTGSTGLGSRPIVDDVSEGVSEPLDEVASTPSVYENAVHYINSFLTNPDGSVCRLTLLQSLIIELGLASSSLPASLTAARSYLKSRAFVNIREYLAVRGQGPEAVQAAMHPSRTALIKDIRRKRNQASLQWVKKNGLGVLLVQCFH